MITTDNYFDYIKKINVSTLTENLKKGHEFVDRATKGGSTWEAYKSESIRAVMETYFKKLHEHTKEKKTSHSEPKAKKETVQREKKEFKKEKPFVPVNSKKQVEHFPEEFKFIRRFVNMDGKTKTADQVWNFLNALQRSITEKRITKTSPYKKEIDFIQDALIRNYNSMKGKIKVSLQEKTILDYKKILGEEVIYPSVLFIKKFIRLHGKTGVKEKAKKLLDAMNRAMKRGILSGEDKYFSRLNELKKQLEKFVKTPGVKSLSIEPAQLNGLMGILGECGCMHDDPKTESLSGIEYGGRSPKIMNSMDFATLQFKTIGFKDKWKDFIGDPTPGFSMMVFAKPKMGKSYLCVDFAGYLARNHGKVLYVAREEGLDYTLQQKLNDKAVKHANLYVSSYLPEDLAEYDFIILDSVNKLGLSPKDLEILRRKNPGKSFVFVFQTTKEGVFRGNNEFQHDVDVVVDIPEKGKAVQFGRFNQGGEMKIFQ